MPGGIAFIRGDVILPRPTTESEFLDKIQVRPVTPMLTMAQPFRVIPSTPDGEWGEVLPTVRQCWKYSDRKMIGKQTDGIHSETSDESLTDASG